MTVKIQPLANRGIQAVEVFLGRECVQLHEGVIRGELRDLVEGDHHHVDGLAAASRQPDAGQLGEHGLVVLADLDKVELNIVVSILLFKTFLQIHHANLGRIPPGVDVDGHILGEFFFLRKRRGRDGHEQHHHHAQENREQLLHGVVPPKKMIILTSFAWTLISGAAKACADLGVDKVFLAGQVDNQDGQNGND